MSSSPLVSPQLQRGLAREMFQEVRLREGRLVAVRPRPRYAPLFAYALCAMRYGVSILQVVRVHPVLEGKTRTAQVG